MASKKLSPTAKLLRNSRLFALPKPLSRPSTEISALGAVFDSDTATLPYPTHPSIETTQSSLGRGDWGLKRPLPLKTTTKTSTPVIRVNSIDSVEHITDYEPAADHTVTLRKWQEMNIPMSTPLPPLHRRSPAFGTDSSVFEDSPRSGAEKIRAKTEGGAKWKFKGPWLAGMSNGDFERFINKKIKNEKTQAEFQKFLRNHLSEQKSNAARQQNLSRGETREAASTPLTDAEFESGLTRLRRNPDELWLLVWKFLDLPGQAPGTLPQNRSFTSAVDEWTSSHGQGPPPSHPSAGLSYLRTSSVIPNHPILGPTRYQPPVEARVLKHANQGARSSRYGPAMVGAGGVVAAMDSSGSVFGKKFDPDEEGGSTVWVEPKHASIDSKGKIKLTLEKADNDAVAVWEHAVDGSRVSPVKPKADKEAAPEDFDGLYPGITLENRRLRGFS